MDHILEFISHHWVLVSFFVIAFFWLIFEESRHQGVGGGRITTERTTDLINREDAAVIDLRDAAAFGVGHIVNSINIPHTDVDKKIGKIETYKSKPIIFVCAAGQQSLQVMHKFKKMGFEKVYILGGGISAWKRANLPLVK